MVRAHRNGRTFLNELFPFNPGVRCSARLEDARSFVWKPTLLTAFTKGLVLRRSHLPQKIKIKKIQTLQSLFEVCRWPSFSHPGHRFFFAASSSSISQVIGFKGHLSLWAASRHVLLVVHELLPVHVLLVVIHVLPGLPHGLPLMLRICGKRLLESM